MAVTTDPFTGTDLAGFIKEVWTPIVNEALFSKSIAANFFTDVSQYLSEGGDIAHVPDAYTNVFTKQNQGTQGAEITTAGPAQVDTTITVSTHDYVAYIIGDKDMKQIARGVYDVNAVYSRQAAGILGHALEDALFALWSGLGTNTVGDTATVLSDAEIRQSIEKLHTLNFNPMECGWFFHPYVYWNQLGAVQKFYDISIRGPQGAQGMTRSGNFGEFNWNTGQWGYLYGIPVFLSPRVVGALQTYRNLLAHPSAFGFAVQTSSGGSRARVQADYLLQNLGMLTVVDMLYGVGELRDNAAVLVNASSAFVGS